MLLEIAILGIIALFHDLGKASIMFQWKICAAIATGGILADPLRHELISALVWDELVGVLDDNALKERLAGLQPHDIDRAWRAARIKDHAGDRLLTIPFAFLKRPDSMACQIGLQILCHHRQVETDDAMKRVKAGCHVSGEPIAAGGDLVALGTPFWHEAWWCEALAECARSSGPIPLGCENDYRDAFMMADHIGSAMKQVLPTGAPCPDHIGNSKDGKVADSLSTHVQRVLAATRTTTRLIFDGRDEFPSLGADDVPADLINPSIEGRFGWQGRAAAAAAGVARAEGGFFACLMAGTGSGKTRGAPAVLAAATFADAVPARRGFRMTLGLGLRVLATQSGREYVDDLGFSAADVSVLVGRPQIAFQDPASDADAGEGDADGSESLMHLPASIRVLPAIEVNTDPQPERALPVEADVIFDLMRKKDRDASRQLITPPVMVGTIDHVMAAADPARSRHLVPALRACSSDLILDEIDQYCPEDIAAICRLVHRVAAAGRRVIVMSATLTEDVAGSLFLAYRAGWRSFAARSGIADAVNVIVAGDAPDSAAAEAGAEDISPSFRRARDATLVSLAAAQIHRRGRILPDPDGWSGMIDQIDEQITELGDRHGTSIDGIMVSIGLVRMTRVSHTAAVAVQLPKGPPDRLRLKICLHSRMPRLHRQWVEQQLKRALTRKNNPDRGLRNLLVATGAFARARAAGAAAIDIVVVASPVIGSGNDLDFDYAIVDPVSPRAVVHTAGHVRRHRLGSTMSPNIVLLGRSPIVMDGGRGTMAYPGIETPLGKLGMTPDLGGDRNTARLMGAIFLERVDAAAILDPAISSPLLDAEFGLRAALLMPVAAHTPQAMFMSSPLARMSRRMGKIRQFKRSISRNTLLTASAGDDGSLTWLWDPVPDLRDSVWRPAEPRGLQVASPADMSVWLFADIHRAAMRDLGPDQQSCMESLMEIDISGYGDIPLMELHHTYMEQTGVTSGAPDDLFQPFGKTLKTRDI